MSQISLDWLLIGRVSLAFCWGVVLACFLQFSRWGKFLAEERTWITVVAGVGVDLLIAYQAEWLTVCLVIVLSSAGIIARSLLNESRKPFPSGYKLLWGIEDAIAVTRELTRELEEVLETGKPETQITRISKALALAHTANRLVCSARRGEYEGSPRR